MKSTKNAQTTEDMNKNENAPTWQDHITEDLNDEAQAAVSGGAKGGVPGKFSPIDPNTYCWSCG